MTGEDLLVELRTRFYADPLGYVMFNWDWENEPSIQLIKLPVRYKKRFPKAIYGPDQWACEFLDSIGAEVRKRGFNGKDPVPPIMFSTASGHGIGKTVLVAWLVKWILDTRPLSLGTVTANTAEQLKTKTWAEVGKWHHLSLTADLFDYSSGRGAMSLIYKDRKLKWRCDAQTCREENSEAFAGQHAATATSFYIFDEASNVPDKIFEVRQGGLVKGEPMVFDFGNPTRNSGYFFENCVGRFKDRYRFRSIDSRSTALAKDLEQHKNWIEDYGLDSDFVKVRILGQFPSQSNRQFIATEDVEAAMERGVYTDRSDPLIIGVDVARFGMAESVIYPRIGMDARSWPARRYRGLDVVQLVGKVVEMVREFKDLGLKCSGLFVDGTGVGGGVVDMLRNLGYNPIEVQFGSRPTDSNTYRYKSDEIWGKMREAIKNRLALPHYNQQNAADLKAALTQREFGYTLMGNKIHLETKDDMAERGITSPDLPDALALTFAQDIAPVVPGLANMVKVEYEYDPLMDRSPLEDR